jgi:hypothetical protein
MIEQFEDRNAPIDLFGLAFPMLPAGKLLGEYYWPGYLNIRPKVARVVAQVNAH